jgi:hypothetical protein
MKINKFWQICVYYILIHLALLCVYLDSRVFGLYPLDVLSYKNEKIHITNVEGYPGFIDGDYHVYTDKGEYINRDSSLLGKFNSHDLQNYMFLLQCKSGRIKNLRPWQTFLSAKYYRNSMRLTFYQFLHFLL